MFRAYDQERDRLVAIKLFRLDLPRRVHELVAELERIVAAHLAHPAIATPIATGIVDHSAYLAVEYVSAESLDLAVREYGPAPAPDALRVAAQLAGALDFAAVAKISNGALHPRDVLLASDDTRLTGIGVAHALELVGIAAPVRRPYSAPERIMQRLGRRARVCLAAVIPELLWGPHHRIAGAAEALTDSDQRRVRARAVFARALASAPTIASEALEFAEAPRVVYDAPAATPPASLIGRRPATSSLVVRRWSLCSSHDGELPFAATRQQDLTFERLPLALRERRGSPRRTGLDHGDDSVADNAGAVTRVPLLIGGTVRSALP